jgi:multidrug resistance efflux pump
VPGAAIFVVVMVLVIPVAVMLGGAIWTALMGWFLVDDAKVRAEGTPYAVEAEGAE